MEFNDGDRQYWTQVKTTDSVADLFLCFGAEPEKLIEQAEWKSINPLTNPFSSLPLFILCVLLGLLIFAMVIIHIIQTP